MNAAFIPAIVPGRALIPAEDRWLKELFDAQYGEYRQRVLVKVF
jgi:protein-S-isoprenylcysteine O-methyltransferase Ste14